ncbi:hypothetical protein vseg_017505 [Gypsophila vaccaria]
MKLVGACMLQCALGVLFLLITCFSHGIHGSIIVSGDIIVDDSAVIGGTTSSRQLRENEDVSSIDKGLYDGIVSLEDYRPYDPSPSSKASVRPGPIEHGTPVIPFIPSPKPSPPPSNSDQDEASPGPSIST